MPFEELKARHSVVWGTGPYERVSATIADLQDELIARLGPAPGVRWLDSATGTGETAKRAARAGADVVGVDIAPALIETARREAEEEGLEIRYEVCDCEALPFEDASFDVVSSTCGVMFAPDHAAVAGELTRVTGPAGESGSPAGRPTARSPRSSASRRTTRLRRRPRVPARPSLGAVRITSRSCSGTTSSWSSTSSFRTSSYRRPRTRGSSSRRRYGPTKTLADSLDDDRREEFERRFVELHARYDDGSGLDMPRTYLLTLGTRR